MKLDEILHAVSTMANHKVSHYVTPGLTSALVGGDGHGKVRLFTADRDTREFLAPFDVCASCEHEFQTDEQIPTHETCVKCSLCRAKRPDAGPAT